MFRQVKGTGLLVRGLHYKQVCFSAHVRGVDVITVYTVTTIITMVSTIITITTYDYFDTIFTRIGETAAYTG